MRAPRDSLFNLCKRLHVTESTAPLEDVGLHADPKSSAEREIEREEEMYDV